MRRIAAALLSVIAAAAPASAQTDAVSQIGMMYCIFVLDGTLEKPNGTMTADLEQLLADSMARNDEIQAVAPDEKPPLGDGIPWTSFPDQPDNCSATEVSSEGDDARLSVTYHFDSASDADYADTLVLKSLPDGWFIDDVIYENGTSLRSLLNNVLAE